MRAEFFPLYRLRNEFCVLHKDVSYYKGIFLSPSSGLPKDFGLRIAVNVDVKVKDRTPDLMPTLAWMQQAPKLHIRFVAPESDRNVQDDAQDELSFWDEVALLMHDTRFRAYALEAMCEMYAKYTVEYQLEFWLRVKRSHKEPWMDKWNKTAEEVVDEDEAQDIVGEGHWKSRANVGADFMFDCVWFETG